MNNLVLIGLLAGLLLIAGFLILFPSQPIAPATGAQDPDIPDSQLDYGVPIPPSKTYQSLSECQGIPYSDIQDCTRQVASKNKDPSACSGLQPEDVDWCKAVVFVANNQFDSCSSLATAAANQCFFEAAKKSKTETYCASVSGVTFRDDCYREAAEKILDTKACEPISEPDIRDDCYIRVILLDPSPQVSQCQLMSDTEVRDDCYYAIAQVQADSSICQAISDEAWRETCITDLQPSSESPLDEE